VPVVGGNVSLYNETDAGPTYPTPVVGMVGELPDPERAASMAFSEGDAVALVGPFAPSLAGSELAKQRGELGPGLPSLPIEVVRPAIELVREAVRAGVLRTAHDVTDGGLATALAEAAICGGVGVRADLDALVESRGCSGETALFGEGAGGFVVAGGRAAIERLVESVGSPGAFLIGEASGDSVELSAAEAELSVPLGDAARAWSSLAERVEGGTPV
jgi:phosphoribosylformylglycinamidine (FGAM) synthase-like enzyme